MFVPKLITSLRDYDRRQFARDLMAGLVVGVVAVPLALAFGIASGVSPSQGLATAVIGGFLVSLLGGSRVQIAGPTGAFVVIVFDVISRYGYPGLAMATIMAGVFLILIGASGLGAAIKFIPYPVVTGFTSGIAVIIFSSQVKDVLGLEMASVPAEFAAKWQAYAAALPTLSWDTLVLAAFTLVLLWACAKWLPKLPGPFIALIAGTVAAHALGLDAATIGSRFGELPSGIPAPRWPDWPLDRLPDLIRPAFTIALLAGIESLLSAVIADGMIGGRHRAGMELVAQGAANIASPLFGGIPVTGAIARTAANVKSGGRTPVAGIVHAAFVMIIILFFSRWAELIPLAVLGAILVRVAYLMSEWHAFASLLKAPRSDVLVLLTTFGLTIFADLTVAVEVGMVMAAFLFMRRMADVTNVSGLVDELKERGMEPEKAARALPPGIEVYDINGPFFFGAADKLGSVLNQIRKPPKVFILRLRNVPTMDATGLRALEEFRDRCRRSGTVLLLSELKPGPWNLLKRTEKVEAFGANRIFERFSDALGAAQAVASAAPAEKPRH